MKKILVVDDLHDVADSTAEMLRLLGHDVRTAYDGREAVEAAAQQRPDVVLLDLNMPVLDGFEAARLIRACYPSGAPLLVALSALAYLGTAEHFRRAGFDHRLTKPADLEALQAIVASAA